MNIELKKWWEAVQDGSRYLVVTRKTFRILAYERNYNKKQLQEKYGSVTNIITPLQYIKILMKNKGFSQKKTETSDESGREYERIVRYVESTIKDNE